MWRLYCGDRDGIALQTTYEKLDRSLPENHTGGRLPIFVGMVQYTDYDSWELSIPYNGYAVVMHKRLAFAHEREVRAIFIPDLPSYVMQGDVVPEMPETPAVQLVDWDPAQTLEKIYVSPYAQGWYHDSVAAVLTAFDPTLFERLCWSSMRTGPTF